MTRSIKLTTALLALCLNCFPAHRKSHRNHERSGQAGQFDFYLLVLSWSPEFCHSKPSAAECSQHRGFLVHGLWPQNNDGSYPSDCSTTRPAPGNPSSISDIMPPEIIQHEWEKHGTCSGLSGDAYFDLIRKAFNSITIPDRFRSPSSSFTTRPKQLKQEFEKTNPKLDDS